MASWRDGVSDHAQAELDGLLKRVLPFAREMLAQHGEFFPYGATLSLDGSIALVAGDPGTGDQPDPADVLDVLHTELWTQSHALAASAVVSDVRLIDPPTDAIRVELEHREGVAISVLLAYEIVTDAAGGAAAAMGAVTAILGERRTWPVP